MLRKERANSAAASVASLRPKRVRAVAQRKGTERPAARAAKRRGTQGDSPRGRRRGRTRSRGGGRGAGGGRGGRGGGPGGGGRGAGQAGRTIPPAPAAPTLRCRP